MTPSPHPHRCPLCRTQTPVPWNQRPWNRALNAHLQIQENPQHDGMKEEDLCARATVRRIALCQAVLPQILGALRKAANEGEAMIAFQDPQLVEAVRKIRCIVADKLFRHGVHRLEIRDKECLVSLVPEHPGSSSKCVFINPAFV